jgi:AraC-like DNA-binding protein
VTGRVVVSHLEKGVGRLPRAAFSVKFVLEGEERYVVDGRSYILRPGEVLIVEPGGLVDVHVAGVQGARGLCLYFPTQESSGLAEQDLDLGPLHLPLVDRPFERWLSHAASVVTKRGDLDERASAHLLRSAGLGLPAFLDTMRARASRLNIASCERRTEVLRRVERARAYLHDHPGRPVPLEELAGVAGLSRFHLARSFQAVHRAPPAAYHRKHRLDQAAAMLSHRNVPLVEVADAYGFSDQSSFTRAFSREYGVPPGAVRNAPEDWPIVPRPRT